MSQLAATAAIVLLISAPPGCRPRPAEPRAQRVRAGSAAAMTPPTQDTGFAGTTAPVRRIRALRPGVPPGMLRAVASAAGPAPGYDRVVFEFTGDSVPGYHVEYATEPVRRCGSGDPVSVAGAARLVVRFEPASAHDEHGNRAPVERERAPRLRAVREMALVCDFEGQVEWVLGIAVKAPYRVSELAQPARLVLDVGYAR